MEIRTNLQCKALKWRGKTRESNNNGKQWQNNAKSNGNNEKRGGDATLGKARRQAPRPRAAKKTRQ